MVSKDLAREEIGSGYLGLGGGIGMPRKEGRLSEFEKFSRLSGGSRVVQLDEVTRRLEREGRQAF